MRARVLLTATCLGALLAACDAPVPSLDAPRTATGSPACPAMPDVLPVKVPVSGDLALDGRLFLAPGEGPKATVAWFHGFPGEPDPAPELVTAVTGAGLNLLSVHYRGAWNGSGAFGAAHAVEDAAATLAFIRDGSVAHACRVDAAKIGVAGVSFGSWVAMHAAAADPEVACAAGALLFDLGSLGSAVEDPDVHSEFLGMFSAVDDDPALGFTLDGGAEGLMAELVRSRGTNALPGIADALRNRPVLLVGAEADALAPPRLHLEPFAAAMAQAGATNVAVRMFAGGHELADAAYAGELADWLAQSCIGEKEKAKRE